jgi:hypothetical protein
LRDGEEVKKHPTSEIKEQKSKVKESGSLLFALCSLLFALYSPLHALPPVRAGDTLRLDTMNVTAPRPRVLRSYADGRTYVVAPPKQQQYSGKYIVASLVVPGAGEMWMKSHLKGEIFLWTDAAVWVSYGTMMTIGNSRGQSAKLFAREFSGSSMNQRTDDYYTALERYPNSDMYNEDVRRDARELYPDDPDQQRVYAESRSYSGDDAWAWGSDSLRYNYWRQRMGARNVLHTAGFVLGAALVDRLASAIDAAFFTRAPTHYAALGREVRLGAAPTLDQPGLTVFYRF